MKLEKKVVGAPMPPDVTPVFALYHRVSNSTVGAAQADKTLTTPCGLCTVRHFGSMELDASFFPPCDRSSRTCSI